MLLSLIVPVKDNAAGLALSVEHLVREFPDTCEAIVVDNGSSDDSFTVACACARTYGRVRVLTCPRGGRGAARNAGIAAARGEYVGFMDAGDALLPGYGAAVRAVLGDGAKGGRGGESACGASTTRGAADVLPEPPCCGAGWEGCVRPLPDMVEFGYIARDRGSRGQVRATALLPQIAGLLPAQECLRGGADAWVRRMPHSACVRLFRRALIERHGVRFDDACACLEDAAFTFRFLRHARSVRYEQRAFYVWDRVLQRVPHPSRLVPERDLATCWRAWCELVDECADPADRAELRAWQRCNLLFYVLSETALTPQVWRVDVAGDVARAWALMGGVAGSSESIPAVPPAPQSRARRLAFRLMAWGFPNAAARLVRVGRVARFRPMPRGVGKWGGLR